MYSLLERAEVAELPILLNPIDHEIAIIGEDLIAFTVAGVDSLWPKGHSLYFLIALLLIV